MKNEKHWRNWINGLVLLSLLNFVSCMDNKPAHQEESKESTNKLPYLGEADVEFHTTENGAVIADTMYYTIPKFSFINQDSAEVSHKTYTGKIFVADFFFTTCPTICPILSSQMARVQSELKNQKLSEKVWLLSHTVDPLNGIRLTR